MTHADRALQCHDMSGEGIKLWITCKLFWPHKDMEGLPDEWSAQCRGHLRDSTNVKDNAHQAHTVIPTRRIWNDDDDGQMIFGDLGGLKFPDICLTGEEKPRKNITQETCPDRVSNSGPLRDKRACCHLLHSGALVMHVTEYTLVLLGLKLISRKLITEFKFCILYIFNSMILISC